MRQLRYCVAARLDGYIAGPNGEYDWIPMDPDFDFSALYARYSAIVMGRKAILNTLGRYAYIFGRHTCCRHAACMSTPRVS